LDTSPVYKRLLGEEGQHHLAPLADQADEAVRFVGLRDRQIINVKGQTLMAGDRTFSATKPDGS
jgi:hypothetical protein